MKWATYGLRQVGLPVVEASPHKIALKLQHKLLHVVEVKPT